MQTWTREEREMKQEMNAGLRNRDKNGAGDETEEAADEEWGRWE